MTDSRPISIVSALHAAGACGALAVVFILSAVFGHLLPGIIATLALWYPLRTLFQFVGRIRGDLTLGPNGEITIADWRAGPIAGDGAPIEMRPPT